MCDYNISGDGVASFIDGEVVSVFVLFLFSLPVVLLLLLLFVIVWLSSVKLIWISNVRKRRACERAGTLVLFCCWYWCFWCIRSMFCHFVGQLGSGLMYWIQKTTSENDPMTSSQGCIEWWCAEQVSVTYVKTSSKTTTMKWKRTDRSFRFRRKRGKCRGWNRKNDGGINNGVKILCKHLTRW